MLCHSFDLADTNIQIFMFLPTSFCIILSFFYLNAFQCQDFVHSKVYLWYTLNFYSILIQESELFCQRGIMLLCNIAPEGRSESCSHFFCSHKKRLLKKLSPGESMKTSFQTSRPHESVSHYLINSKHHIWGTKTESKKNMIYGSKLALMRYTTSFRVLVCTRSGFWEACPGDSPLSWCWVCTWLRSVPVDLLIMHLVHSLSEMNKCVVWSRSALCLMLAFHKPDRGAF